MEQEAPARWLEQRSAKLAFAGLSLLLVLLSAWAGYYRPAPIRAAERFAADLVVLNRVEGFASEIELAAQESGLDPCLLAAIVYCESSGRPGAVSHKDAIGLMQLVDSAARDSAARLGLEAPSREELIGDPGLNLRLGASHFAWTLHHEGDDLERALVAYNTGRARLARWVREAGSYEAWREERTRAGDSSVLRYARRVLDYSQTFCDRGALRCEVVAATSGP
jgi:soluble lytic murein transglycosylase-like protein